MGIPVSARFDVSRWGRDRGAIAAEVDTLKDVIFPCGGWFVDRLGRHPDCGSWTSRHRVTNPVRRGDVALRERVKTCASGS